MKKDKKDRKDKTKRKTSIGGQALIEGVMMRGPKDIAIAVRKPDGEIIIDKKPVSSISNKLKFLKLPIFRGIVGFFESMIVGVKSLMYSAEFFEIEGMEDEPESKLDMFFNKHFGDKAKDIAIYISVIIAMVFGVGLFMLLPTFLVGVFRTYVTSSVMMTFIEGVVRILIFLAYLILISRMKDIQRVFEYHGAEHKTIYCYENEQELTIENVKKQSRLHPRCGTNFLLIVMIISIIVFSFLKWDNVLMRMATRLALLPLVAGISYEIIKLVGRYDNIITRVLRAPGMWLQVLTTKEPDDSQIEVAIAALNGVLTGNKEDDKW